jgi:hypothetical protein
MRMIVAIEITLGIAKAASTSLYYSSTFFLFIVSLSVECIPVGPDGTGDISVCTDGRLRVSWSK